MSDRVLQIDAMLIRHEAAMRTINSLNMRGEDLLAWVLMPPEDFYNASIKEAKERGPSKRAHELAHRITVAGEDAPRKKRPPQAPMRLRPRGRKRKQVVSIAELSESYAA